MKMKRETDAMGRAIAEYYEKGRAERLRVLSPMFDEDEIPVGMLFRSYGEMTGMERKALDMARGRTLDVGAGAGCHSLVLQQRQADVTAIDISPLAAETMRQRGIRNVMEQDFFEMKVCFDTILMLMNGIGIVGTVSRLPMLFRHLDTILAPGGQLLCDSSDISYVFADDDGTPHYPATGRYYGELQYRMQYRDTRGEPFGWLYIDAGTLRRIAAENGYQAEVVMEGDHCDYLARITKSLA